MIKSGAINASQLETALAQQKEQKLPIGQLLVKLGYVSDDAVRMAIAAQLGIPYVDLDNTTIDRNLARVLNRTFARRHVLLPVAQNGRTLTIVMDDPTRTGLVDDINKMTGLTVTIVTSSAPGIQRALQRLYDEESQAAPAAEAQAARTAARPYLDTAKLHAQGPDEQVSQRADELFQQVLTKAIENRCSDIHIEMLPAGLHVRFRVDGVLREPDFGPLQQALNRSMREVVSRIKILAKLDISERRRPQDGSFRFPIDRKGVSTNVDLRVSMIPSYSGESVVIRILDRTGAPSGLADLKLTKEMTSRIEQVLKRTAGIFLVTGPTGSGKSTTLYACLSHLRQPEIRILTAEDPVEYVYDDMSQTEVNTEIGNTFAAFLRAFLRHDPEIIMVGEIRDEETAEMSFRAAQTGHLLLSTLHTNSALAALPRLLDLGVDPSLVASSLMGVISQRLARQVCSDCRKPDKPSDELMREFFGRTKPDIPLFKGAGCIRCHGAGYRGRTLVADLWVPDEHDNVLIMSKAPFEELRKSAQRTTISMAQDAHSRLAEGRTTIEELARVLPYTSIVEHRERAESGTWN